MSYDHWKTTDPRDGDPDPYGEEPEEAYQYGHGHHLSAHLILPAMTIRDVLEAFWQWQEKEAFWNYRWSLNFDDYLDEHKRENLHS